MHALIIEDEYFITMVIEDSLRPLGYTSFDVAHCLSDAVEAAKSRCPDLIISDQRLADGMGTDAVSAICSHKIIPVVFVTASPEDVKERLPDAIIVEKPFHHRAVEAAVRRALDAPFRAPAHTLMRSSRSRDGGTGQQS